MTHRIKINFDDEKEEDAMKVLMDDGHDWVFMNNDDGRVYDSKGEAIRWVPIDDWDNPKMFGWMPIGDEEDQDDYVVEEIKKGRRHDPKQDDQQAKVDRK